MAIFFTCYVVAALSVICSVEFCSAYMATLTSNGFKGDMDQDQPELKNFRPFSTVNHFI